MIRRSNSRICAFRKAALKLMRKLLKKQGVTPTTIVTDKLRSYSSALRELGVAR
jgi:putative transposase